MCQIRCRRSAPDSGAGWLCLLAAIGMAACAGAGTKGPSLQYRPSLEFQPPAAQYQFLQDAVPLGGEQSYALRLTNLGNKTLTVARVYLEYEAPADEPTPAFRLEPAEDIDAISADHPYRIRVAGEAEVSGNADLTFQVFYTRNDDEPRQAQLMIVSDDQRPDGTTQTRQLVAFETRPGSPHINVANEVDLGRVQKDPNAACIPVCQCGPGVSPCCSGVTENVVVSNTGNADLAITGFKMTGDEHFVFVDTQAAQSWRLCGPEGEELRSEVVLDEPHIIGPSQSAVYQVRYVPENADAAEALLSFFSNDSDAPRPEGASVRLRANSTIAILQTDPAEISFGGTLVGFPQTRSLTLTSVGSEDLLITGIDIATRTDCSGNDSAASRDFTLDLTGLPAVPSVAQPLTLAMNESLDIAVQYMPDMENPLDAFGQRIPDFATLRVDTANTFEGHGDVCLNGVGISQQCPAAVVSIREGQEVIPQTVLHLEGDQSFSANAPPITGWQWEVEQPEGSQSIFIPSATFPNPTFEANVAGEYRFRLHVWDSQGIRSCEPAEAVVVVVPDEAIHVELLWSTPGDDDETDEGPEAGSDLDLHFAHAFASGEDRDGDGIPDGWFDQPFDCFWFNSHPNWGSFDPSLDDDPGLDRDDTDGAGPENINLNVPEDHFDIAPCGGYRVGVHYWNDHGFGPSYVTVRVYVWSELVFELSDVKLVNRDFWEVCCIDWPSGAVDLIEGPGGSLKITPSYPVPFFGGNP